MGEQFIWNPSAERMGQMLRQAVFMEDGVTLEHLVKQKADIEARDETGATLLHIAATQCKPAITSWLIQHRADISAVDSEGFGALTWACVKGHHAVVTILLDGRADIEGPASLGGGRTQTINLAATGATASAPEKGKFEVMVEKTPLSLSAERGHFDVVVELLSRRATLEATNRDGSNALMCAAHHGETEVVAHLLWKCTKVNHEDKEGWTALMYAENAQVPSSSSGGEQGEKRVNIDGCLGKKSMTELLILHAANVNAQTADGLTPLIIASSRDRPAAVKKLLETRAQVNLSSARGQAALLMAAAHDLPNVVRALVMHTADVNQVNAKNDSPLSLAEMFKHKEVVDLLKKAGAAPPKGGKKKKKGGKKK